LLPSKSKVVPLNDFTVEMFPNGDMRHTRGCRGAVPMLLTRRADTGDSHRVHSVFVTSPWEPPMTMYVTASQALWIPGVMGKLSF
jgi:hypothetical protein